MSCPCGSGRALDACCGRFIHDGQLPGTAEELMRSRYTAYAMREIDYLLETHRPPPEREGVERFARAARFTGLTVIGTEEGGPTDARGLVEFEARFELGGKAESLRERSHFERVHGRWYYVDPGVARRFTKSSR